MNGIMQRSWFIAAVWIALGGSVHCQVDVTDTLDIREEQKWDQIIISITDQAGADTLPVFTAVERMPRFPGGEEARLGYLRDNIRYPQYARHWGIQGRVFVSFIVEKDGTIAGVKVLRGIGGGCDEEAMRVISNMTRWEPGTQKGEPVRVQFNMPILFKIGSGSVSVSDLHYSKGHRRMEMKQYESAVQHFSKSIDSKSAFYKESFADRGICHLHLGHYDQAVSDIREAQKLGAFLVPEAIADAYFNIAHAYMEQKRYPEAIDLYTETLKLKKDDAETLYNRGVAYFYAGEKGKACEDWHQARELGLEAAAVIMNQNCR
ncbi:MAG: TonB family protein [Bacteroidales bacterium]|nr:TonB family protein [Bacteroidales bacterium]